MIKKTVRKGKSNIVKQGWIKGANDLFMLNILDWNRLINYWDDPQEAAECIVSWLKGHTHYAIFKYDLTAAPMRDDWPGWKHVGNHEPLGQLYWNWFYQNYQGEIHFSDSPDFHSKIKFEEDEKETEIWGDVGKVSPPTFMRTIRQMDAHDAWISVIDSHTQVLLEPTLSIFDLEGEMWEQMMHPVNEGEKQPIPISMYRKIAQLPLF